MAAAACVADPSGMTLAAGATGGVFNLREIFSRNADGSRKLVGDFAKALEKGLENRNFHMPAEGEKLLPQMLETASLTPEDMTGCALNADAILGRLLDRHAKPEHRTGSMAEAFCNWLRPPLEAMLNDPQFAEAHARQLWTEALGNLQDVLEKKLRETVNKQGMTEGLFNSLAHSVANDVPDIEAAQQQLSRLIDIYKEMETRATPTSNQRDLISQVMQEMGRLNADDDFEGASEIANRVLLDLQSEQERQTASSLKLLNIALAQDILRNDAPAIAQRLLDKLSLETPDSSQHFIALQRVFAEWYEKGRDKGLALELQVATELAEILRDIASDADQRSIALNNLGLAFQSLSLHENNKDQLQRAVTAFENALLEETRERIPLEWAKTQNNLGNALTVLGERENNIDQLHRAVTAFENALLEQTRERVPLVWSATQSNLGSAIQILEKLNGDQSGKRQSTENQKSEERKAPKSSDPLPTDGTKKHIEFLINTAPATAIAAGVIADQITAALRNIPAASNSNQLPPEYQTFEKIGEIFRALSTPAASEPVDSEIISSLKNHIQALEKEISELTKQLTEKNDADSTKPTGTKTTEQGFKKNYVDEFGKEAAKLTAFTIKVGLVSVAVHFLGESSPALAQFLKAIAK